MKTCKEPLRLLSGQEMEALHAAAVKILETVGMRFASPEALEHLSRFGCRVEEPGSTVRFPPGLVNDCVERMRSAYRRPERLPERMAVRYSHIRFRAEPLRVHTDFTTSAGGFCAFIWDLEGRRRPANGQDVLKAVNLVNNLAHIDYTGLPVSDQSVPAPLRPVKMAGELAKYTRKLGGVETFKKEDVKYLIEIGRVVAGGEEELRKTPVLVGYAEARSPLAMDRNMTEIFMEYVRNGLPQTVDTMPNGGATAPVTAGGLLALAMAETLGPLVLGYAIDPEATLGVDIIPSYCDMSTGIFRYASAERLPLLAARVQLISEFYGCPSGVHGGKTDSCFPNVQAGIEKSATMLMPLLAGAVGIGTVGHLENAVTFSPLQLAIDNELAGYMHRALTGIEIDPESLAAEVIDQVGIGGNYLEHPHTARHFRRELFLSPLFETMSWESAHTQQTAGMEEKARELAGRHWRLPEPVLNEEQVREIDRIVARAERELC